jgi:anti-sigma factor ChrR (cupin superfamily)
MVGADPERRCRGSAGHPSAEQLEAVAFGHLADGEAGPIRAHAATCPACARLLAADAEVKRLLDDHAASEPAIDVVSDVLHRLD